MKFVKDSDSKREDYIFQDNLKTRFGTGFIITILVLLIVSIIISGFYLDIF